MSGNTQAVIRVFYCYAPADKNLLTGLEKHLSPLKHINAIAGWSDQEVLAGTHRDRVVRSYLYYSDLILLLISPDFLSVDFCYSMEMEHALDRHAKGEAVIIPIILRPVMWGITEIRHLQALPKSNKPVTIWSNRDAAFYDVAVGITKVVKELVEKQHKRFIEEYLADAESEARISNSSWIPTDPFRAEKRADAEELYKNIYDKLKSVQMEIIQQGLVLQQYIDSMVQDETDPEEAEPYTHATEQDEIEAGGKEVQVGVPLQHEDHRTTHAPYENTSPNAGISVVKLFILGLPGSGKSALARAIVDYVNHQQISGWSDQQWSTTRFNDDAIRFEMFHQDIEGKRFKPAELGGFDIVDLKVFDEALQVLEQKVDVQINSPEPREEKFIIIEFSRNNYQHAFQQFNRSFLANAYFLYLHTDIEECKERIRRRVATPQFGEDDHPVSDYIFENYYFGDDGAHLVKILIHQYQVARQRLLIVKNNGSIEEVLEGINRFVDAMLEDKAPAQSISRSISGGDEAKYL